MISLLPFAMAAVASASCARHHTCCSEWDFFIPVSQTCVESEPTGADNCARNGQSKVPIWARFETKEWRLQGVCNSTTRVVTRAEIEAKEEKQREFMANYTKFCTKNAAKCSSTETCYYARRHLDGDGGSEWSADITDMGSACLCSFTRYGDFARAHIDGSGKCVLCASGPNGTQPFVQKTEEPGAKSFHNGEFACAFGPKPAENNDKPTIQI